jgi:hypothetical protein
MRSVTSREGWNGSMDSRATSGKHWPQRDNGAGMAQRCGSDSLRQGLPRLAVVSGWCGQLHLPAGSLTFALGGDVRRDSLSDTPEFANATGRTDQGWRP